MARLPGPILRTERLILQTPRLRDVPAIYKWVSDASVTRYLSFESPNSPKDTLEFVRAAREQQGKGTALTYVLRLAESGEPIGCCGVHDVDTAIHHKGEVGYWLAQPYWGRGMMQEALRPFLAHVFGCVALHRLCAYTFVANTASARLLERLGFQHEGTLRHYMRKRGRPLNVECFALLSTDPAARRLVPGAGRARG